VKTKIFTNISTHIITYILINYDKYAEITIGIIKFLLSTNEICEKNRVKLVILRDLNDS